MFQPEMQIVTDHLPHPVPFQGLATKRKGKHCLMNNSQLGSVSISASNWASVSIAVSGASAALLVSGC